MLQTITITVNGKVQGVFYRQSTKDIAIQIGVTGHVKNLADGAVEITATGTKEQLDQLLTWCRQGPPRALVSSIDVRESPLQLFDHFSIVRF